MTSKFLIQGMDCSAEEQVIKNRFGKVEQVTELEFDLVNRILTVTHEYDSDLPIRTVLKEIGLPPEDDCDVGCTPEKRGIGRADIALGVALALAILAEVVAYSTGNERSWPVLGLSLTAIGLGGVTTFKKGLGFGIGVMKSARLRCATIS